MKHISITAKITLLYMITLIIISAVFLAAMVYAGINEAGESARRVLMEEVTDASEEIDRSGTSFTVDSDIQYYHNGVYLSIFDENKELLEGRRPAALSTTLELQDKALRRVKDGQGRIWYVYDSRFDLNGETLWVRGYVNDFTENNTLLSLLRFLIIGTPLLIAAAAVGGYLITKRAFRPVGEAVETAAEITRDGDLSRRLPALSGGDEVSRMTDAFNGMFDRLEKTVEDEKRFTNDAAHELRTPLAVIQSQSEYALEDESYQKRALEVINRESKTMSQMVNQLLMLARGDAGRLEVHPVRLDLGSLSSDVAEQQETAAEAAGMELSCEAEEGVFVRADEFMTIRILLNLISNALKYGRRADGNGGGERAEGETGADSGTAGSGTDSGSGTAGSGTGTVTGNGSVTVRVSADQESGMACLSVEDDGPGIPEDELERVWERFYRGSAADRYDKSGKQEKREASSGLGLAIVKALAEAQGGSVSAESRPYEKTVFNVMLPLADDDSSENKDDGSGKEEPA
ncbi:MAG: sensor histidine kinase [Anaerovoracaceae bacterium]|jgi:signal transduction histidine kinase